MILEIKKIHTYRHTYILEEVSTIHIYNIKEISLQKSRAVSAGLWERGQTERDRNTYAEKYLIKKNERKGKGKDTDVRMLLSKIFILGVTIITTMIPRLGLSPLLFYYIYLSLMNLSSTQLSPCLQNNTRILKEVSTTAD